MPLTVVKQDVLDRFPELAVEPEVSNLVWDELIADANAEINVPSWLDQASADRAGTWLIAHMVTREKLRITNGLTALSQTGQLQSVTVGPVTKTWAPRPTSETKRLDDDTLELTEFGTEYLRLRSRFCRGRR
jgi:hypothetical protein